MCFYLRFATSRCFRILCWLAIWYLALTTTAVLLINLFGCAPVSGAWDRSAANPSVCVTTTAWYITGRANIIFTDVVLLLLPIPIVARLRLGWLGLVAMPAPGFL